MIIELTPAGIEQMLTEIINAAKRGDANTIRDIYKQFFTITGSRIEFNFNSPDGYSPLFYAASQGHLEVVKILIQLGAKPEYLCTNGLTALHAAAKQGHLKVVDLLLRRNPMIINMKTHDHNRAVDLASDNDSEAAQKTCAFLMLKGADIDHFYKNPTFIDFAKYPWATEVLKLLLDKGADINARESDHGWNALMTACSAGCEKNVDLLLSSGANISLKNYENKTVMMIAESAGFPAIKQKLMNVMYRRYQKFGFKAKIPKQTTPSCGFFTASFVTSLQYKLYPERFKQGPLFAPEKKYGASESHFASHASLRSLRHTIGIQGKGEIFTHAELRKIIGLNQCSAETFDIDSYEAFERCITDAIDDKKHLIIPYSIGSKSKANGLYSGTSAHWAAVIDYVWDSDMLYVLIAENGLYTEFDASELFDRFYNIEDTCKNIKLYKINPVQNYSQTKLWVTAPYYKLDTDALEKMALKTYTVPETDLSEFRRKLTVVTPPPAP